MSAKRKKKFDPSPPPACPHCGGKDTAYWSIMIWICRGCGREFAGRLFRAGDPFMKQAERRAVLGRRGGSETPEAASAARRASAPNDTEVAERRELMRPKPDGEHDADASAAPASGRSRARRPSGMNGSSSSARRAHSRPDGLKPSEEHTS